MRANHTRTADPHLPLDPPPYPGTSWGTPKAPINPRTLPESPTHVAECPALFPPAAHQPSLRNPTASSFLIATRIPHTFPHPLVWTAPLSYCGDVQENPGPFPPPTYKPDSYMLRPDLFAAAQPFFFCPTARPSTSLPPHTTTCSPNFSPNPTPPLTILGDLWGLYGQTRRSTCSTPFATKLRVTVLLFFS